MVSLIDVYSSVQVALQMAEQREICCVERV
jgi:hypothetical protein